MREKYLLTYDYCDPVSDDYSAYNIQEVYEGTYSELQQEISKMKHSNRYYNIEVACIS